MNTKEPEWMDAMLVAMMDFFDTVSPNNTEHRNDFIAETFRVRVAKGKMEHKTKRIVAAFLTAAEPLVADFPVEKTDTEKELVAFMDAVRGRQRPFSPNPMTFTFITAVEEIDDDH